ncbi:hypothetical protein [Rickettsia endosymbiont of Orchestes rusci]
MATGIVIARRHLCRRGNPGKNSKKCYETYYFLDCRTPSSRSFVAWL